MSWKAKNPRLPSLPSPKSPCFSLLLAIATVVAATFAATVTPYTHRCVKHMFRRNNSIRYILSRRPCMSICTLAKILIMNSSLIGYWSFWFLCLSMDTQILSKRRYKSVLHKPVVMNSQSARISPMNQPWSGLRSNAAHPPAYRKMKYRDHLR